MDDCDTWTNRDLPILRAAVKIYGAGTRPNIRVSDIQRALDFDSQTIQTGLNFLYTEPYFREEGSVEGQTGYVFIGAPTADALRVAGAWPSPENLLARLVTALKGAAEDATRAEAERRHFKESAELIEAGAPGHPVALKAFGGADAKIVI